MKLPIASILLLFIALSLPNVARADCPTPSTVGVVICQPSANSIITNVPHIEANTNPTSGAIVDLKVWIDGKLMDERNGPQTNLFPGGIQNGRHFLQVQAHDGQGRFYGATEFFTVTGIPTFPCPPSGVGVRICWPVAGQFTSQDFQTSVGFKGTSRIKFLRYYLDGKDFFDFAPPTGQNQIFSGGNPTTAGVHTLTVVAWDTANHVYKNAVTFGTYYDGSCPPKGTQGCNPGIFMNTPQDGDDVQSPFRVSGSVEFNNAPITNVKAFLDGKQVGESFGPTFDQPISASKGTHILVLEATDTQNKLYKIAGNVNVQ